MLALSIALGTIIVYAVCVAIKMRMETPDIESEKLTQERPHVNGSSAATELTGKTVVGNDDNVIVVLTTTMPEIIDVTASEKVINVRDKNWTLFSPRFSQKPVENRTEFAFAKNTTVAENGDEIAREEGQVQAENDTIAYQLNRATATGSFLCWPFVTYSFIIFR